MGGVQPSPPDLVTSQIHPHRALLPQPSSKHPQTPTHKCWDLPSLGTLNEGTPVGRAAVVSGGPLVSFPNSYLHVDTLWEKGDFPSRIITPLGSTLISLEQSGLSVRMGSYCGIAYSVRAILGNFLSQTGHEI